MLSLIASTVLSVAVSIDGGRWNIFVPSFDDPIAIESSGWVSNSAVEGFGSPRFVYAYCPNQELYFGSEAIMVSKGLIGFTVTLSHRYGGSFRFEPLMGKRTLWIRYKTWRQKIIIDTDWRDSFVPLDPIGDLDEKLLDQSKPSASPRCIMMDTEDVDHCRVKERDLKPGERYVLRFRYLITKNATGLYEPIWYYDDDRGWKIVRRDEVTLKRREYWTQYEKLITVPQDVNNFSFTFRVRGDGQLWIDDVSIELLRNQRP